MWPLSHQEAVPTLLLVHTLASLREIFSKRVFA
jgi:hypothetical protein